MKEAPNTYHVIDITMDDGSNLNLSVVDYGKKQPQTRWKLNNKQISRGDVTKLLLKERK